MRQPSDRHDPYDADRPLLMRCSCGQHGSDAEHAAATLRTRRQNKQPGEPLPARASAELSSRTEFHGPAG